MTTQYRNQAKRPQQVVRRLLLMAPMLCGIGALAQDRDDFVENPRGPIGNEDSVVDSRITIGQVQYGGSGCPAGSVSSALSDDKRTLSILFSEYAVAAGGSVQQDQADCVLKIPFQVPTGIEARLVRLDYRGFVSLPEKAVGALRILYSINDQMLRRSGPRRRRAFVGPIEKDFMIVSAVGNDNHRSTCGRSFELGAHTNLIVASNQKKQDSMIAMDSIDTAERRVSFRMRWRPCGEDGRGNSGRRHREGRPGLDR